MGDYTALHFVGIVKKKYVKMVEQIENDKEWIKDDWKNFAKEYPFTKRLSKCSRSGFIPFGGISAYNEDKFGKENYHNLVYSWDGLYGEDECATWTFLCDLKNYSDEIEIFIKDIAEEICDTYIAEVWSEDSAFPIIYKKGTEEYE